MALLGLCTKNVVTMLEEILHIQTLPKFKGWPRDVEEGRRFFKVDLNGEIEEKDRATSNPRLN